MEKLQELLHQSFDKKLEAEDQQRLEKALTSLESLREEKKAIETIRKTLSDYNPSFNEGFTDSVMANLHKAPNTLTKSGPNMIRMYARVALSGAAAIAILLGSIYLTDGSIDMDSIFGITDYAADGALLSYLNY